MTNFIRLFLPLYFILFFGIAFLYRSWKVAKSIHKSAVFLPNNSSPDGLVGYYFKVVLISIFLYVCSWAALPEAFGQWAWLDRFGLKYLGALCMVLAFFWTYVAQKNMKNAWRIGIDTDSEVQFVAHGLFRYSRNPIFLGMLVSLVGLFLITPNSFTFLFLVLGFVLISLQISFEEVFLAQQLGAKYTNYKNKVRRYL
jgi:protein-S-isoprenylcysteine O-methyltransferase Ste14